MTRFRLKLTTIILGLISAVLIVLGVYFANVLERTYMESMYDLLKKEAILISEAVQAPEIFYNQEKLRQLTKRFDNSLDARITIINSGGEVIYDSGKDPVQMENHANRPEFHKALQGEIGTSRRQSDTLGYMMSYVAVPVENDGQVIGAVRTAMSMQSITNAIHQLWFSLLSGLVITLVVALIVSARISYSITRPIEEITRVARNITQRKYESRVKLRARDEIGQLAGAINFMATSLERQMYEISENQQRLSGVLTNMVSGVIFVTENRRIMLVNPAAERLLGLPREELEGKLHIEAGHNFGLSQYIDKCIDTGERIRQEVHLYYPHERILDVNIAPYINAKGEKKGVVTVLHDITEIRRLEKMRSEFVANVSHELRTPITSIKGFTETLLDGAMKEEDTCRHFLQIISDESDRLYRLISDILDLSRIEQRKIMIRPVLVNVHQLVRETFDLVQEQVKRKRLEMILPDLPEVVIETDKDCLQQILLNLVSNAIAYTPEGGKISVRVREENGQMMMKVEDTGIGIPEKDIPRIFERFYRVDKARARDSGGTGLGLAIVKHLVEALNGRISVKSVEGVGSTFTVQLPLTQEDRLKD